MHAIEPSVEDRQWPVIAWPPVTYWARTALAVVAIVVMLRTISILKNVLLVILASFVFAIGLQPAVRRLERRGWPRGAGVLAILAGFLIPTLALLALLTPMIGTQATTFIADIPDQLERLRTESALFAGIDGRIDVEAALDSVTDYGQAALPRLLRSGTGFVFNLVTVLVLTPYFAVSMPGLKLWIVRLFERQTRADMLHVLSQSSTLVANYVAGNLLISLIAFIVSLAGLWLIGVPYPLAVAAWIAVTDLIPVVGAVLGAALAVLIASFAGAAEAVTTGLFLTAYQQVENYVIAPRIMRRAVDVTPPMVIIALMIGGSLAGLVGALLALPVAAMLKAVVTEFYVRRRIERVRAANAADESDVQTLVRRTEPGQRPPP